MPSLNWIGREAVVSHHNEIPYRLLRCNGTLSAGDSGNGNLLVEGDNLEALKALLPYYAGEVKCIYIDPPYNTGNADWAYNDNVDSPQMRSWLGRVVGREGEDLSRHDKWLCMMYPRLQLLREFLSDDGIIFVSVDENEHRHLELLMDEVFGPLNHMETIIWKKSYGGGAKSKHIVNLHEYIVCFAKNIELIPKLELPSDEGVLKYYRYRDSKFSTRGPYRLQPLATTSMDDRPNLRYAIPYGSEAIWPEKQWQWSENRVLAALANDEIVIRQREDSWTVSYKQYLKDETGEERGRKPYSIVEGIYTQQGTLEVKRLFGDGKAFSFPKPSKLIKHIVQFATSDTDLILDSFAGSGTTGDAVLQLNQEDGGNRRFILVEMESEIARRITSERLRRVIEGYEYTGIEKTPLLEEKLTVAAFRRAAEILEEMEAIEVEYQGEYDSFERRVESGRFALYGKKEIAGFKEGTGGGFRYCTLGPPLFDETGSICPAVSFGDLAAHIYYSETGEPLPERPSLDSPYIGQAGDTVYYLLFNGVRGGSQLDAQALRQIEHSGPAIVYADGCRLSTTALRQCQITFKQIPYEVVTR